MAVNGTVQTSFVSPCLPYDGTLLVGCQQDASGELFRFGEAAVESLLVEDGAITAEEAAERSGLNGRPSRF